MVLVIGENAYIFSNIVSVRLKHYNDQIYFIYYLPFNISKNNKN